MAVIGVTGILGAGKSTVAGLFEAHGAQLLDADRIAHRLIRKGQPCFRPVLRAFGRKFLRGGEIDRKKIAQVVFSDPRELKKLTLIIHPPLVKIIKEEIARHKKIFGKKSRQSSTAGGHRPQSIKRRNGILVVDAALLIELELVALVDYCVVVTATRNIRLKRVTRAGTLSRNEVLKRMRFQLSQKEKLQHADIIIDNNGSLAKTKNQVERIWSKVLARV